MGPLVIDFLSTEISEHEQALLRNPFIGGVILFARNFVDSEQLKALTAHVSSIRPDCLICVDHEGGRVQRFKHLGFTRIPPMGLVNKPELAYDCGVVMAYELKSHGLHVNFAPVLDRDCVSNVIGDRGFSANPSDLIPLASELVNGFSSMNMPACGKHFPGHGSVEADSHVACPIDTRTPSAIQHDLLPFTALIQQNALDAIMPAHVVYEQLDALPAGYSQFWLQQKLKQEIGFKGIVFSDDLSMQGASLAGTYAQRAYSAYTAGCDFLLLCNAPEQIEDVLCNMQSWSLRPAPNCSAWFRALPEYALSSYQESLLRLKQAGFVQ